MAIFAISDLHLSSDNSKSMEVFGHKWSDYMNKIKSNWKNLIMSDDIVIISGDVSWATYLEESVEDFRFLSDLPGKKIILKGNHDYWWETINKMNKFLVNYDLKDIEFIHNNSIVYNDILICGSRGWNCPEKDNYSDEDLKIFNRELIRIKLSLESGVKIPHEKTIVCIHYPPFNKNLEINEAFLKIFREYDVDLCIYGHLHGITKNSIFEGLFENTEYKMVSADYLEFVPCKIA